MKLMLASLATVLAFMAAAVWGATCEAQGWGTVLSGAGGVAIGLGMIVSWMALAKWGRA